MFKKMTLVVFAMLLSVNLYAGDYDGAWRIYATSNGSANIIGTYLTIHQKSNNFLVVYHPIASNGAPEAWSASLGSISGNVAQVETIFGDKSQGICIETDRLEFSSSTEGKMTVLFLTGCPVHSEVFQGLEVFIKKVF